jgi:hypothetical protein
VEAVSRTLARPEHETCGHDPIVTLSRSGIFGFHLTFSSGLARTVLTVEAAGVAMLLLTAAVLWPRPGR